MASVKVKFRPSTIEGKTGALYFQVIHRRIVRSQKTKYKIYPDEWNARTARITLSPSRPDRHSILSRYRHEIKQDLFRLSECIANLTRKGLPYSTDDLLRFYRKRSENDTLTGFMTSLICHLKEQGRIRTGETYQCTLNSFMRFRNGEEIILDEMNQETIEAYEAYLKKEGICPEEYFLPTHDAQPDTLFPRGDIRCYAQWGGSEGIYIELEVLVGATKDSPYKIVHIATGKTLDESAAAYDRMQYIAGRIYKAFCGEGFQPSRYCIIDSGGRTPPDTPC